MRLVCAGLGLTQLGGIAAAEVLLLGGDLRTLGLAILLLTGWMPFVWFWLAVRSWPKAPTMGATAD